MVIVIGKRRLGQGLLDGPSPRMSVKSRALLQCMHTRPGGTLKKLLKSKRAARRLGAQPSPWNGLESQPSILPQPLPRRDRGGLGLAVYNQKVLTFVLRFAYGISDTTE